MLNGFYGNGEVAATLSRMMDSGRMAQTILLHGPAGIGKATLVRRFAATLLGGADKVEADDLSRESIVEMLAEREKLPSDKRADDPLLISSHPDFVTFPPDGPLRQISIQQIRLLKERAQFGPLKGNWRVFLIDQVDRANEQAANSLLKILEEPPRYLIVFMTAENPYDLLPTIRSRSLQFGLNRLDDHEMRQFVRDRKLDNPEGRLALAGGCPGAAASLDWETFSKRREAMLALIESGLRRSTFGDWAKLSESIAAKKSEKLDDYLSVLYMLLEDLLVMSHGRPPLRNRDLVDRLQPLASAASFSWIRGAVKQTDELSDLLRRNIQKGIALDAMSIQLRARA